MIKDIFHTILSVFLHPIAMLVYFTYLMLTRTSLAFFLINPDFGRSFFAYVILMSVVFPVALFFASRLRKKSALLVFRKADSRTMLIFAVYFTMVAFFAHTQIALLSVLQHLPAIIATTLLIFNELTGTNSHVATLTSFATTFIIFSIALNTNYLVIILASILLLGILLFQMFEKETVTIKTALVSVGIGAVSTGLYFLILYIL